MELYFLKAKKTINSIWKHFCWLTVTSPLDQEYFDMSHVKYQSIHTSARGSGQQAHCSSHQLPRTPQLAGGPCCEDALQTAWGRAPQRHPPQPQTSDGEHLAGWLTGRMTPWDNGFSVFQQVRSFLLCHYLTLFLSLLSFLNLNLIPSPKAFWLISGKRLPSFLMFILA